MCLCAIPGRLAYEYMCEHVCVCVCVCMCVCVSVCVCVCVCVCAKIFPWGVCAMGVHPQQYFFSQLVSDVKLVQFFLFFILIMSIKNYKNWTIKVQFG